MSDDHSNTNEDHNPIYGDPFQVLIDHFEANKIRYSSKRSERRAWFTMNSGHALQKCIFRFDKPGEVLQIFIQYPVLVKEKFRAMAAEFLTRANYSLVVGKFEMDMKDGEVRFHVSHLMSEGKLDDGTICRLFGRGMGTADRYFPALMQVLFAGATPEDAVYLAELDYHAEHVDEPSKKGSKPPKEEGAKSKGSSKAEKSKETSAETTRKKRALKKGASRILHEEQEQATTPQKPHEPSSGITPIPPAAQSDTPSPDQGNEGENRKAA